MLKKQYHILEIASATAVSIALFMVYAYSTRLLPSWHMHSEFRLLPFVFESCLAPLPVVIPTYVAARITKQSGGLIGLLVALLTAVFALAVSQSTVSNAFNPSYEWMPEHWFVIYLLLGYFVGTTGQAHAESSKKQL